MQEEEKPKERVLSVDDSSDKIMRAGTEIPKGKSGKKLLLKSVLGGIAAFGLAFMLLNFRFVFRTSSSSHIFLIFSRPLKLFWLQLFDRRNGREKAAQSINAASNIGKEKAQKYSIQKVERKSTTQGVYPAEKLG